MIASYSPVAPVLSSGVKKAPRLQKPGPVGLHNALVLWAGAVPSSPLHWKPVHILGSFLGRLRAAANRVAKLASRSKEAISGACERIEEQ